MRLILLSVALCVALGPFAQAYQDTAVANPAAASSPCDQPLTYCAPTSVAPLPIPDAPPAVSTTDPFIGKGTMFKTPWSNSDAMRLTDGTTVDRTSSFGLFYAGQSDPAVRSPMLGARASQNCNHGSPTCYYMRLISTGAIPKVIWVDGGSNPTQGTWKTGDLCADNPYYQKSNGYTLYPAYNYGATTGNTWHAPKFLQTPGSEGILLDVELRTAAGARNGGATGSDAWLVARDLTACSSAVDVPETPVVDFSALYPGFDPTHTQETQGFGPAFTEGTASAVSTGGVVSLQSGIYCVTLSKYSGDDSHGTAVVCYDASLGKGHWLDIMTGTTGPDFNGWGQSGPITTTCATSTCQPLGTYISAIYMNSGTTPYMQLDMANQVFWDLQGLNLTMIIRGVTQRIVMDHVMSDAFSQFSMWPLSDYSKQMPLSFPPPNGWSKPSNYANKIVFPGGLYYVSNHLPFTGPGDPGVAFISAFNGNAATPCVHDVGGTCGIYGIALDGSGTEYSFFPHFASLQVGGVSDTIKPNLAAYIDSAGFTWIYWGSDWMGNLGCSDGVTASNCSATGKKNRADVFAAVLPGSSASLSSITVTPANTSLSVSDSQQYTATGTYTDGATQDLTGTVTWNSSSPSVATITSAGLATAVAAGTSTISATSGTVSGSTTLTVVPPSPVLISIAVSPANGSAPLGTAQQFTAIGTYSDGSTADLTASVIWSSSATNVLVISNAAGTNGQASTIAAGQTTVTASLGNVSESTVFTVLAPAPVSLSVSPQGLSVATGSTTQLTATGTYTDGTTANLTSTVTWTSSTTNARVNASGVVTAITPGSAVITATLDSASASTSLNISRMSWQPYANPTWDGPVSAIVTAANGDMLLGANGTGVYKSSDGYTWTLMGSPAEPGIESLLWSGTALYAGTHDGVFISNDEGATWAKSGGGLRTGTCVFALLNSNGALFAATDQGLYRMAAGSTSWSRVINGNEFRALFAASSGRLLAGSTSGGNGGGPGGDIFTSTDGITWTKVGISNAWSFRAFGQDAAGTLYAGVFHKTFAPGGVYTSVDGGSTWSGPTLGAYSVQAITATGASVYLGTREGVLFAGPQTWQPVANPSGKSILSLAYPFLGSDGIYRLDDDTHPTLGSTPEVMQVLQDAAGRAYWRSSYFGIWSSTEGYIGPTGTGAAWQLDNLMFLNAAGELVALDQEAAYHRVNGQWIKASFPSTPIQGRFYTHVLLGDGTILITDVNDRIWKSTDGGSSFAYMRTTSGLAGVLFDLYYSNGLLYAASEGKSIIVSGDGGNTWNPLPPFVPGGRNVNTYAVTITAAGMLLGGRAGGTSDGSLFRYVAGAWQRSDQGIPLGQSVYRLYATPGAVYALTECAIYQSVDDGQTWTALSAPKFFSAYTAEFRPLTVMSTADGRLILGIFWEGRGAYLSAP